MKNKFCLIQIYHKLFIIYNEKISIHCRKASWDERNYRRLGLPYTYEEIVDSPMDEFNELMNNGNLNEEQVILCRNTRRRGKNKVILIDP